ncbi:putative alpha-1,2-mannosidase [Salinivirga cyanobacteriivorans]|uniref:Putative alpha-1,2-mannosidase n=1 Tax=Salinivirga cyanobacteriivorans TaxID=1307839 RepID=A0A0S2HX90_9BACT|nr:GH92 family glycosyl hydrolase [Salinivirga cyanobacteriivorans]ALO14667.1 putative alpha-1,2-mannosidase [Salinivirga cyanobacteriivorans]
MKFLGLATALMLLFTSCSNNNSLIEKVNPFIGTGGHGHTYPGATYPFGFVQLSPDTRLTGWDGCSGYHYSDERIYGFSHTHLSGTGVSDYADVLLMPRTGPVVWQNGYPDTTGYFSHFSHEKEYAEPGYYRVSLDDYDVDVELTATAHCGFHKYQFHNAEEAHVILDLNHRDQVIDAWFEQISDTEIAGLRRSKAWARDQYVYFVMQFNKPVKALKVRNKGEILQAQKRYAGKQLKAALFFNNSDEVKVKVGLSAVDVEGARKNLETEIDAWDFDQVRKATQAAWKNELGKFVVKGGTHDQQVSFYTALYHNMIVPNIFTDVDGRYRGHDSAIHHAGAHPQYTVFSLWDTYRATHPLYTLMDTARTNDFIHSFLRIYQQGGRLPVWELAGNETDCMIGYHSVPVIVDAMKKGIGDFDQSLALEAMQHSAMQDHFGLDAYREMGVIPLDREHESVSKTLEYAFDDWCIAQSAQILNNETVTEQFLNRAQFYKNLYDPSTNFFRARENGGWLSPFDPREVNFHHTEANAWQYTFYVPQDVQGMIQLMGGDDAFTAKLDSLFTVENKTTGRHQVDITGLIGQYAHGNEPSHHTAYLYNYAGKPWKTQQMVRRIMDEFYKNAPDGLAGNEDCGQMSAWYVLSAMGMYPVNPADGIFVLGSPIFDEVTLNLENGRQFTVKAENNGAEQIYVQRMMLNDKPYHKSFIDYETIMKGGSLVFFMGEQPNKELGTDPTSRPASAIAGSDFLSKPIIEGGYRSFKEPRKIHISNATGRGKIYYTLNGGTPDRTSKRYTEPFTISNTTHIRAIAIDADGNRSYLSKASFYKMPENRSIEIKSTYNPQYSAGGDEGLIDLLRGPADFRTGFWQGYQDQDFEAVVDLSDPQKINYLALGCLQDIRSWIWMPVEVVFYVSQDGKNFRKVGTVENSVSEDRYGPVLDDFELTNLNEYARFVKVVAKNYGTIPDWHMGHGGEAFIFVDEIVIE